jgi:hypothetical protein
LLDLQRGAVTRLVRWSSAGLVLSLTTLAATARAQSPAGPERSHQAEDEERGPDPGARAHDGFYLRLHLGPGYTHLSASDSGGDLSLGGKSLSFGIALGGAVSSHVIVYGTVVDGLVFDLSSKQNQAQAESGMIEGFVNGGGLGRMSVLGVGAGAAYYLDSNVFFASSVLGSRVSVSDVIGAVAKSDWGVTFEGLVGKEWWVSDNWGLGVAGQLLLGVMKDGPNANTSGPRWTLAALSVLFSATFN